MAYCVSVDSLLVYTKLKSASIIHIISGSGNTHCMKL